MVWVAPLLVASTLAAAPADGFDPFAVATPVAFQGFDHDSDRDYDGLPDRWTRRTGPSFPGYVAVGIDGRIGHDGAGGLRFTADGAAAAVYGPPVLIDGGHHYLFEGYVRTQRLRGDAAVCSISILDYKRQRLARYVTMPVSGTHAGWVRVRVGPIAPMAGQRFLVVGCHLVRGGEPDLEGEAWFDDLRVGGAPVLALTGKDARFRRPAEPTTLIVTATGLEPEVPYQLSLSLRDVEGKEMDRVERAIPPATAAAVAEPRSYEEQWAVPGAQYGFYRFEAELRREAGAVARSEATFVVTDPGPITVDSPFGWSTTDLPGEDMTSDEFSLAASEAGISRVKLPLWRDAADRAAAGRAADLVERLAERQVATVGMLDPPPDDVRRKFSADWSGMGEIFRLRPEVWGAALEPVVARHGARVRHWQLGRDGDRSFSELPDLAGTLTAVRAEFDRVGHNTRIGIPWPSDRRPPGIGSGFVSMLDGEGSEEGFRPGVTETWAAIRPLATGTPEERGADMVRRIVAARAAGATGIVATDVLDPQVGMVRPNGSPTELFLPWRTVAVTLRGSTDLGPIAPPQGSQSRAFEFGDSATVVLWSDEPKTETITPGGSPMLLDMWGRMTPLEVDAATGRCAIPVGPSPVFVTGASAALLRWQMTAGFEQPRLRSQHGPQPQAVVGTNPFGQGVSGTVTLVGPEGWEVEPNRWPLRLAAGESFKLPVMLTLPADASLGAHDMSIEFDLQADRPYRFSVRRELMVGLGDIDIEVTGQRLPDGRLEVVQTITNRTSPLETLNFRCDLFVPGVQRQRQYVVKLGEGRDTKRYYLPSAADLIGQELWLRAEQESGRRVLNYRWVVREDEQAAGGSVTPSR